MKKTNVYYNKTKTSLLVSAMLLGSSTQTEQDLTKGIFKDQAEDIPVAMA